MQVRRAAWLVALAGLPAWTAGAAQRDGAGIRIVENPRPRLPESRMWRIGTEPLLQIGGADQDTAYEFLRVMGAVRYPDGRILAGNQGTSTLRWYDARGRFLASAGRNGDGPGEFRQILGLFLIRGDSIAVYDVRRTMIFGPDGKHGRTYSASLGARNLFPWAFFEDGSFVAVAGFPPWRIAPRGGRWVDSVTLVRVGPADEALDTLVRVPFSLRRYSELYGSASEIVFGPRLRLAVQGMELYAGFPDRAEIRVHRADGRPVRIIRWAAPRRPVPAAARDEYRARLSGSPGEDGRPAPEGLRARRQREAAQTEFVEQFPPFSQLLVDRTGHLWALEADAWETAPDRYGPVAVYTPPHPTRWNVFAPDGAWVGTVRVPSGFMPFDIGPDYVLGVWRNTDDVEHLRLYALTR